MSGEEIEILKDRIQRVEDKDAIRELHFKYGYYMDRRLFDEVVALFDDACEVHFMGGVFLGLDGARRLYCGRLGGLVGLDGFLIDHLMMQDIVSIDADGHHASARFRCLVQGGAHRSVEPPGGRHRQYWHAGIYENRYVRRDRVWKISHFGYTMVWEADYDQGWAGADPDGGSVARLTTPWPEDPFGPDRLEPMASPFPANRTVPFHYPNPVTGADFDPDGDVTARR